MGTRDDEYDYLFKGTAGEAQTGDGAAARQWTDGLKQRSRQLGPGRSLGPGESDSWEGWGRLGPVIFGPECTTVRNGRPRGA